MLKRYGCSADITYGIGSSSSNEGASIRMDFGSVFWASLNIAIIYVNIDVGWFVLTGDQRQISSSVGYTFDPLDLGVHLGGRALLATLVNLFAEWAEGILGIPQGGPMFTVALLVLLGVEIILRDLRIDRIRRNIFGYS